MARTATAHWISMQRPQPSIGEPGDMKSPLMTLMDDALNPGQV